jgi:serine protease inhibitor
MSATAANANTLAGLESCFRFQLSFDFKSFKTLEIYKKLTSAQIENLSKSFDLTEENKLWKLSHYKIINEYRSLIKQTRVSMLRGMNRDPTRDYALI